MKNRIVFFTIIFAALAVLLSACTKLQTRQPVGDNNGNTPQDSDEHFGEEFYEDEDVGELYLADSGQTVVPQGRAEITLLPKNGTYEAGQIVSVDILLNTFDNPIDGVDIRYLNYDSNKLLALDEDPSTDGIQIIPGELMEVTPANMIDEETGRITFSQLVSGGKKFSNNSPQVLATVRFEILDNEETDLFFDFTPSKTTDTNVSSSGADILTSAQGAHLN